MQYTLTISDNLKHEPAIAAVLDVCVAGAEPVEVQLELELPAHAMTHS
jgi:hypothetical protein